MEANHSDMRTATPECPIASGVARRVVESTAAEPHAGILRPTPENSAFGRILLGAALASSHQDLYEAAARIATLDGRELELLQVRAELLAVVFFLRGDSESLAVQVGALTRWASLEGVCRRLGGQIQRLLHHRPRDPSAPSCSVCACPSVAVTTFRNEAGTWTASRCAAHAVEASAGWQVASLTLWELYRQGDGPELVGGVGGPKVLELGKLRQNVRTAISRAELPPWPGDTAAELLAFVVAWVAVWLAEPLRSRLRLLGLAGLVSPAAAALAASVAGGRELVRRIDECRAQVEWPARDRRRGSWPIVEARTDAHAALALVVTAFEASPPLVAPADWPPELERARARAIAAILLPLLDAARIRLISALAWHELGIQPGRPDVDAAVALALERAGEAWAAAAAERRRSDRPTDPAPSSPRTRILPGWTAEIEGCEDHGLGTFVIGAPDGGRS